MVSLDATDRHTLVVVGLGLLAVVATILLGAGVLGMAVRLFLWIAGL